MNEHADQSNEESVNFVPQMDVVLESLADEIGGWAAGLGIELTYMDPVLEEGGRHEWAARLRQESDWALRTAETLLTGRGKDDLAEDLRRRMEELCTAAGGYEQRLEAMEGQRRVHVEGIVSRYRQAFGDGDPEATQLGQLCQGINRVWTFGFDDSELDIPEDFAEAIDRAWFEEDGAKRRDQAEMKRRAGALGEHVRLLAGMEAGSDAADTSDGCQKEAEPAPAATTPDTTADDDSFGGPQEDPFDPRAVRWVGKRLYLGPKGAQIRELFWLLAKSPGVPHTLGEVQRAVDGMETYRDEHGDEAFQKSMNRIAKALSKLRKHLRENDLDDHVLIVKEGPRDDPSYTLIARFGNS